MRDHFLGNCWNKAYYKTHVRTMASSWSCSGVWVFGKCIHKVHVYCPSGYDTKGLLCYQRCGGGYQSFGDHCWQPCPHGFTTSLLKNVCIKNSRLRSSQPTHCNAYQHQAQHGTHLKPHLGKCVQTCKHGHTEFLGFCYPPSTLKVSIAGIFDPFQKIIAYIKNTPIGELCNRCAECFNSQCVLFS